MKSRAVVPKLDQTEQKTPILDGDRFEQSLADADRAVRASADIDQVSEEKAKLDRVSMFGIDIDVLDMNATVERIFDWTTSEERNCKYVVTPNVDHVVMLQKNRELRQAYNDASLVVADGFPLIMASKWLGTPLPERVAGSELVPLLFDRLQERETPTRIYLLGAMPGVAVKAARAIDWHWPNIKVVGTYSPPFGFQNDEDECESILQKIRDSQPEIVVFGVGAPKQEIWTQRFHKQIDAKVLLCVGATIDFLAGEKAQAPVWMRRSGLEWLHRCASEPKRLLKRYMTDARVFPQIFLQELWQQRASK